MTCALNPLGKNVYGVLCICNTIMAALYGSFIIGFGYQHRRVRRCQKLSRVRERTASSLHVKTDDDTNLIYQETDASTSEMMHGSLSAYCLCMLTGWHVCQPAFTR